MESKLKIVLFHDNPPAQGFAGATVSTYDLALGLQRAGHEVFVITTCRGEREAGWADYCGLKVFKIATDYPGRWRAYLSLYNPLVARVVANLLKEIRPDVAHINNIHFYLSYHCFKLAKRYARAVIFTARDVMPFNFGKLQTRAYLENFDCRTTWRDHLRQAGKRWNPLRNFFIRRYLKCADRVVAVSRALKIALEQNGITAITVIHTGANLDAPCVSQTSIDKMRHKYGLKNHPIIFFGGRLGEAKGARKALEVMVRVAAVSEALLLVAAEIDQRAEGMKREAERLGIGDRVIFVGWLGAQEIKEMLALADIVLVLSICFDSFPRVVLEAMALGRPVIGTCYGGASEIIVDGETGYVVNPFKIETVSDKAIDLLSDPRKAAHFGQAGQARVRRMFDLKLKVEDYLKIYQQVLDEK